MNAAILHYSSAVKLPMLIPEESGVYVMWDGPSAQYVGHSTNLRRRIRVHISNYGKTVSFTFQVMPPEEAASQEHLLIEMLLPALNVRTPTPDGSKKPRTTMCLRRDVRRLLDQMREQDNRASICNMIEHLTLEEARRRGLLAKAA